MGNAHRWISAIVTVFVLLFSFSPRSTNAGQFSIDERIDAMSLEHKVAQMFVITFFGTHLNEPTRKLLETWQPGAVALLGSNVSTPVGIASLINDAQSAVIQAGGLPLFVSIDQEGGQISHLREGFTIWPVPMLLTASGNTDLAYRVGWAMAEELLAVGINMNLAPVADLSTNLRNTVIGRRSFGTDPQLVAPIIAAFVRGMQDQGVMATAKHFPGHGDTSADSHVELPVINHDRQRLETVELVPFKAAFDAGVGAVMVGHLWYSQLEPGLNVPASLSRAVITDYLRGEIGYNGLVMTDAMDMDAVDIVHPPDVAAVRAVQAGNDLLIVGAHAGPEVQARAMQAVVDAVRSGLIDEAQIDASVRRVLEAKARFGVLDWEPVNLSAVERNLRLDEHARLVDEIFNAGTTIAFDSNRALPLTGEALVVYPASRPSIKAICETFAGDDIIWLGVSANPTDDEVAWVARAQKEATTVVVFTQSADVNPPQQKLVNAIPPEKTIVVALWSPYDINMFPEIAGYVLTYSPLQPAVPAACGAIFGGIQSQAALPIWLWFSLPVVIGQ